MDRSSSTACSADVRLGGASGGTEAHQDPHSDRGGSHGYYIWRRGWDPQTPRWLPNTGASDSSPPDARTGSRPPSG